MRTTCIDCAIKHVAQAEILLTEAAMGYPSHKWLAMGHLAEAEAELIAKQPDMAAEIRQMRILIANDIPLDYETILEHLLKANDYGN